MSTILESVNNLSEKLGVEEREQTIKDQLDLCVERLGGEGNSVDIAESANKFADKEDGTATFTTKSITENGTYAASDDGVSGYSSVTVDVANSGTFYVERKDREWSSGQRAYMFLPDAGNGSCTIPPNRSGDVIITSPIKRINYSGSAQVHIAFTPDEEFDGLYIDDTKDTVVGDEVTPGDGKVYDLYIPSMGNIVCTKYDIDFSCAFVFKSI